MTPDLFWIPGPWRGRLAIVSRPRGGDWLDDEASGWLRAGIDVLVSLLEPDEAEDLGLAREQAAAERGGIEFRSFPIPDCGVPDSAHDAVAFISGLMSGLEEGRNIAVHCRQGIGRSGLIAVGALITAGIAPEEAVLIVSTARGLPVPETAAQRRWLERLPSRLPISRT